MAAKTRTNAEAHLRDEPGVILVCDRFGDVATLSREELGQIVQAAFDQHGLQAVPF